MAAGEGSGQKLETSHLTFPPLPAPASPRGLTVSGFSGRGEAGILPSLSASPPFPWSPGAVAATQPRSHLALTCPGLFLVSGYLQLSNWSTSPTSTLPATWSCYQTCYFKESNLAFPVAWEETPSSLARGP